MVGRLLLGPDRLHRLDPLAHQAHPRARVGAVVAHLLAVPAGPHSELQAAPAEAVDGGDLFGGGDRVALDDEADAAAYPQPRGGLGGGGNATTHYLCDEVLSLKVT
jgi:hypothetical protein